MHEQSCWFANQTYCIFDVLAAVAIVICYTPYRVNCSLHNALPKVVLIIAEST